MKSFVTSLLFLSAIAFTNLYAQNQINDSTVVEKQVKKAVIKPVHQMNFIKLNLTALPLKNIAIQYERVLSKSFSAALTFRVMPSTTIPFKSSILSSVGNDDIDVKNLLNDARIGNFSITPEGRFYVGKKGYGRGFYIAAYYRFAQFSTNRFPVSFEDNNGDQQKVNLTGKLTTHTGGIMFGAQWALSKRICFDWWILGAHYGTSNGDFNGVPNTVLSVEDQADIRQTLNDIDLPLSNKNILVTSNYVSAKLSGPWAGLRAGLTLGVKF